MARIQGKDVPPARLMVVGASVVLGGAFIVSQVFCLVRRKRLKGFFGSFRLFGLGRSGDEARAPLQRIKYPHTRRCEQVDVLHGVSVRDPYRWLEDPDAKEVQEWVEAQNKTTDAYFEHLETDKQKFTKRMTELLVYDKYSCIWNKGGRYFYYKKEGLQNQAVLYFADSPTAEPRVLIDPNLLRADGTASLSGCYISEDGKTAAYAIQYSGSDWQTFFCKDVETGEMLPDELHWIKFSGVAWLKNGKGFFYSRYPAPSTRNKEDGAGTEVDAASSQKVYYHRLGTTEEDDVLFFESPENPKWLYSSQVTDDGETLLLSSHETCDPVNRLFYFDLRNFDGSDITTIGPVVKLIDHFENKYEYITNDGRSFYFLTNKDAPKYKVMKAELFPAGDPRESDPDALAAVEFKDVIPEDERAVLDDVNAVAGKFFLLQYLRDVTDELEIASFDGTFRQNVPLPGKGSLESVQSKKDGEEFFFKYTSFEDAGTVFRGVVDRSLASSERPNAVSSNITFRSELTELRPEEFETTQEFYKSKDGTRVPMFIVRSREAPRGKPAPTFLYGYGGFNISIKPSFNVSRLLFVKHYGGVYVVANIRGGGEYGEEWHNAGTKQRKQNVLDDFIAAAEYLISKGITTPSQLVINGGSNGGLLVGACINQRPDLFGAAVAQVGVMDMLRFHKFTIGYAWCSDYGNADESKEDFDTVYKYSPVHNVNTAPGVTYPATLILTGDHDDRVVPLHSYKYIAALQHGLGGRPEQIKPLLIRVDTKSGHGAGKPVVGDIYAVTSSEMGESSTSKLIEEHSDMFAFIARNTGGVWRN